VSTAAPLPVNPGRRLPWVEERSAGGVVVDVHEGSARIAVIARRNRAGRVEWCLPKGHIEPGETLPETAAREVAEETGITAAEYISLGKVYPSPGFCREVLYIYLARKLTFGVPHLDDDEFLDVEKIHLDKLYKMAMENELEDGKTVVAVLKAMNILGE